MILAAVCTSMPTYLGGSSTGSPVCTPTRMAIGPPQAAHRLLYGGDGLLGRGEGVEESIALVVHLVARAERLPDDAAVLAQGSAIFLLAQLFEQPRRALDVGEDERHRAAGLLRHLRIFRQRRRSV